MPFSPKVSDMSYLGSTRKPSMYSKYLPRSLVSYMDIHDYGSYSSADFPCYFLTFMIWQYIGDHKSSKGINKKFHHSRKWYLPMVSPVASAVEGFRPDGLSIGSDQPVC